MKRLIFKSYILIVLLIMLSNSTIALNDNYDLSIIENVDRYTYSLDTDIISYIQIKDGNYIVKKDGKQLGKEYEYIKSLIHSNKGINIGYIAKKDGKYIAVKNGIEIGNKYENIYDIQFIPDSNKLSYFGKLNGKSIHVVDGIEVSDWYSTILDGVNYGDDGKNFYFRGEIDAKPINIVNGIDVVERYNYNYISDFKHLASGHTIYSATKQMNNIIVKDGIEYNNVESYAYSENGKHFIYSTKKDGKYILINNGTILESNTNLINQLRISSDGYNYAYSTSEDNKKFVMKNGIKIGEGYDTILSIQFLGNTNDIIYKGIRNGKSIFIKNGEEINEWYDWIEDITYPENGGSYSYKGKTNKKYNLIKDGNTIIEDNHSIYNLMYSKDGGSFSYSYKSDSGSKSIIVRNGIELGFNYYDEIYHSIDSKSFSYKAIMDGKKTFVVDGKDVGNGIYFKYGPKGRDYSFIKYKNRNYILVVNGEEVGEEYEKIYNVIYSKEGNKIVYSGKKDGKIDIVTISLKYTKIDSAYKLSTKEIKLVNTLGNKINNMSLAKRKKYNTLLTKYLDKFEEGSKKYEIIKQLLTVTNNNLDFKY